MYKVVHDYTPSHTGDISLTVGNSVDRVKELENGWSMGHNISTGETGTFPAKFVIRIKPVLHEVAQDSSNDKSRHATDTTSKRNVHVKFNKNVDVVSVPSTALGTNHHMTESSAHDSNSGLGKKLLKSKPSDFRCIKTVLGLIAGLPASGALFLLLVYIYDYSYEVAGYLTLGLSIFIMLGLAMSHHFRCILLLMIPSLSSSKGRTAFLSLIFGLLLTGPIMNITFNAKQVSKSMACATDVIYNQTLALKHQLEEPLIEIAQELEYSFQRIKNQADDVLVAFEPIEKGIESFISALEAAASALKSVAEECKSDLEDAETSCKNGIESAKSSCEAELDKYDFTDDIANAVSDIFGKKRRRRYVDGALYTTAYNYSRGNTTDLKRYRRAGILSSVCEILDVSAVCKILDVASAACDPFSSLDSALSDAADLCKSVLDEVVTFFAVSLDANFTLTGGINASQTSSEIVHNVVTDIESKTAGLLTVTSIVSNILGLTLLLLFFTSSWYLRKYLSKDYYDNIYITSAFRKYDDECKQQGKESVLPLKRKEIRKYTVTLSPLLSLTELSSAKKGFATVFLHFIITVLIIFFNYVLYYLLSLVKNYGDIAIISSGINFVDISVDGNSLMAQFIDVFLNELDLNVTFDVQFNFTVCLPQPSKPSSSDIPIFLSLYFVLLVLLIVQAYGYRIRRKIASFYFPEQEQNRIIYLHEKIRYNRKTLLTWLKELIKSRFKGGDSSSRVSLRSMLTYRHRRLARCLECFLPPKKSCLSCDVTRSSQVKLHKCVQPSCKAVYCDECYDVMKETCLLCDTKRDVQRRTT